jgi:hypothetical protein
MLEVAKPIAVALCMLSLCAVFNAAFLVPASDLESRLSATVILLSLTVGICLASGMIFRESAESGESSLMRTAGADVLLGFFPDAGCLPCFLVPGDALHFLQGCAAVLRPMAGGSHPKAGGDHEDGMTA